MNKIIKVIRIGTPEDIRKSIKNIISQLEKQNYAFTSNVRAIRLFSRYIPVWYKENDIIIISRPVKNKNMGTVKNVVVIKSNYYVEKKGKYGFAVELKK